MKRETEDHSFEGGPPRKLEPLPGLVRLDSSRARYRALLVVMAGWAPLAVLTATKRFSYGDMESFLLDVGVHARFLIAAPLLILAESTCLERFTIALKHFADSGIVRKDDRGRYAACIASSVRLLNSTWMEIIVAALAYGAAGWWYVSSNPANLPAWQQSHGALGVVRSAAAQWHVWVSFPLLLVLMLGWVWRQVFWSLLLFRISRLDLQLIAAHPDCVGGLAFLSSVVAGYGMPAFAFSIIIAGTVESNLRRAAMIFDIGFLVAATVAFVLALFVLPFGVFSPSLFRLRERGVREYGALGRAVGEEFEAEWLKHRKLSPAEALQAQDFSATIDLYQTVSGVHQMKLFPMDAVVIGLLLVATLTPFIPPVLAIVPLDEMIRRLVELFL